MSLSSAAYLVFLAAAMLIYYLCPGKWRWCILLATSGCYYVISSKAAALYLAATIAITWASALFLQYQHHRPAPDKAAKKRQNTRCRLILAVALGINFATLFIFKYLDPTLESLGASPLGLLLPLGISFYIFQTSGYLIDVYRAKVTAERNILKYALFASYFPQIIQGPIGRWQELAPQLFAPNRFDADKVRAGIQLMIWGMLKKVFIADTLHAAVSDVYANYTEYSGIAVFLGAALYCIQLYADFSGGTDIVRGVSRLFGVELAENFQRPYLSRSLDEFWRRWHTSLGEWMKDYLFYPLALSKWLPRLAKKLRPHVSPCVAKLIVPCISTTAVFLAVGIWQGPGAANIAYGLWNGLLMSGAMLCAPMFDRLNKKLHLGGTPLNVIRIVRTCLIVIIGRYFSNSDTLSAAFGMLARTFTLADGAMIPLTADVLVKAGIGCVLLLIVSLLCERGIDLRAKVNSSPTAVQFALLFASVALLVVFVYLNGDYTAIAYVYENV
ncbi:MAG: MBOAT family protein [Clostridia bacterium]|nr:MBOAT family protein [Clostridia bacterium]